jgi:hypothetical protein
MEGWFSMRCRLTWKLKGTRFNRFYFQLAVSTLPIEGIESGLLPTPMAQSRATDEEKTLKRKEKYGGMTRAMYLEHFAAMGLLPTPAAQNYKGASSIEALEARGRLKDKADNLCDQFAISGKTSQLNPLFVEQMMGFPENWTLLPFLNGETNPSKPTETQ